MTNPTNPFNWQMPTASDLVTDLPADFETFGQAVATSMADLLGGTTGQVLSKASNTDMDFTWVAQDDSNAIQNAIVDAKGDLIAASAADTPARLAVGTNGQSLVADSTAATGLKWGIPNASGCSLTDTSPTQTIATSTWTALTFNDEIYDTNNFHSTSSNTSRLTATFAGKYMITYAGQWGLNATGQRQTALYKNGSVTAYFPAIIGNAGTYVGSPFSHVINLAVNDYIEVFVNQNSGTNVGLYKQSPDGHLTFTYLGA